MNKKLIKRILFGALALFVVFVITLGVHIYMVTAPIREMKKQPQLQLTRIDFKQEMDSVSVEKIKNAAMSLDGVHNCLFNPQGKMFVVGFYNDKQNSEKVYKAVMASGNYKAEKFVPTEEGLAKGCPAIDKSSFTYQLGNMFEKLFS